MSALGVSAIAMSALCRKRTREMRVLVCGGRDFDDVGLMLSILS